MKLRDMFSIALLLNGLAIQCAAQGALAQVFEQLRSSDPNTVAAAQSSIVEVVKTSLPTIEKDATAICKAISDPNPYVRLQATGILVTVVRIAPEHNAVVSSCASDLINAAMDSSNRVRNNALFAMVANTGGPPPSSRTVLINSMASRDLRTSQLGAVGLLKLGDEGAILDSLKRTGDAKRQLNLLYAIGGAQVKSPALFESVQRFLIADDRELQAAAVDAIAATAVDPDKAVGVLQPIINSATTPADVKMSASAAIQRLGKK